MRKLSLLLAAFTVVVASFAALAVAADGPTPKGVATHTCTTLRTAMGTAQFAARYGTNGDKSNAFGKCVVANTPAAQATVTNAAKACDAERAKDPAAFLAKYGTNAKQNGDAAMKNAFGKCVSQTVKQAQSNQDQRISTAAATCKAARKADPSGFVTKWGGKAQNALGKCVSATSKTK